MDEDGRSVRNLNELEIYKGMLMANVFMSSRIALINLQSGKLIMYLKFEAL